MRGFQSWGRKKKKKDRQRGKEGERLATKAAILCTSTKVSVCVSGGGQPAMMGTDFDGGRVALGIDLISQTVALRVKQESVCFKGAWPV